MLLFLNNSIIEIRPGELFEAVETIDSRYLEIIEEPVKKKVKTKGEVEWQVPRE